MELEGKLANLNSRCGLFHRESSYMKMLTLSCGKENAIHEPAVNVPTDLTPYAPFHQGFHLKLINEVEEKSKGTCSSTVVKITVQRYRDQQLAAEDDAEL